MKVVILCGGKGVRLKELTEDIPKPLIEIGDRAVVWHVMKIYEASGFTDFILCTGYKGGAIEDYFEKVENGWRVQCVDTGVEANKAERVRAVRNLIDEEDFFCTYADGLAKISVSDLLKAHKKSGRVATMTCVSPVSQFGIVEIGEAGVVREFREKPPLDHWINGGFFVFNQKIFDYLEPGFDLEDEVFGKLALQKEILAYKLNAYWQCMDTFKDMQTLNQIWKANQAPWKIWD